MLKALPRCRLHQTEANIHTSSSGRAITITASFPSQLDSSITTCTPALRLPEASLPFPHLGPQGLHV